MNLFKRIARNMSPRPQVAHLRPELDNSSMMRPVPHNKARKIVVVGTSNLKRSEGKASSLYFPKFGYALAKREVALIGYHGPAEALRGLKDCDPARTAVVLVYSETRERHLLRDFAEFTRKNAEFTFYNGPKTGEIIGDKPAANRELSKAGILTPQLADGTTRVFFECSNGQSCNDVRGRRRAAAQPRTL